MAIYTVHVPRVAADPVDLADRTAFVRDGFSGWAFLFGPLFLARHRAWLAAAAWLVLVLGGAAIAAALDWPVGARVLLALVIQLFLGLEGNSLRRDALRRRGYDLADVVAGTGREHGELLFFRGRDDRAAPSPAAPVPAPRLRGPFQPPGSGPVIGSFPAHDG